MGFYKFRKHGLRAIEIYQHIVISFENPIAQDKLEVWAIKFGQTSYAFVFPC